MFIPVGYANMQWLFQAPNGRNALTAIGFAGAAWAPEDAEGGFIALQQSTWWTDIDDSWTLTGCRVIVGMTDPSAPVTYEYGGSASGGNAGGAQVPNVSYNIRKRTARGGRKGRGRCYFPGVPDDYVGDDGMITAPLASMLTGWTDFVADVITNTSAAEAVLLHADATPAPDPITSWELDPMVATQRRRLRG